MSLHPAWGDARDTGADPWRPAERVLFRWAFVVFLCDTASTLASATAPTQHLVAAVEARIVTGIVRAAGGPPPGASPDWVTNSPVRTALLFITVFVVAAAVASLWTCRARTVTHHRRLLALMRVVLRYYTAIVMLIYGGFKVVNSQFPPLQLDQLLAPLGAVRPMGMLWAFMGSSETYTVAAGLVESGGAILLFFRRTTTLGSLIVAAAMTNVALMNWLYGVPVRGLSTTLVLVTVFLAAPDLRRVWPVLLGPGAAQADHALLPRRQWRTVVKGVVVLGALVIPVAISARVRPSLRARSPLYGVYEVADLTVDGVARPPLTTDTLRWRRLVFTAPGSMAIQYMSDRVVRRAVRVDTMARRLEIAPRAPWRAIGLSYRPGTDSTWSATGTEGTSSLQLTLRARPDWQTWPLTRGFHWFGT